MFIRGITAVRRPGLTYRESVNVAEKRVKDTPHLIRRHGAFWRPNAEGYTTDIAAAGVYSGDYARGCLSVEGLSVVPIAAYDEMIDQEIATTERRLAALKALRSAPPCR